MLAVRERKPRDRGKAGNRWILSVLLIRATPAWGLLSCLELGTKLLINTVRLNGGLGFAGTA